MAVSKNAIEQSLDQEALLSIYLSNIRQRFKDEVNRLSKGAMRKMIHSHPDAADLSFPLTYLYAFHWLQHNVPAHFRAKVLESFRGPRFGFLMELLQSETAEQFIQGYIQHWLQFEGEGPVQQVEFQQLMASHDHDAAKLAADMLATWKSLGLFTRDYMVLFKQVGRDERNRYEGMLGAEDQERLALVDALPDPVKDTEDTLRYAKLGIIPAMGCPQTCRHCMFTWRPPKPKNEDHEKVYQLVNSLTDNVLFTGGDLTKQLDYFYEAIGRMPQVTTFAILLNGDFADDLQTTRKVLKSMADAILHRPYNWPKARVLLQISFDEFHQEVTVDKKGHLMERIPVAKIANIVETYPSFAEQMQLALLHKQTSLNFSMDVLQKGVFARLTNELGKRGHQVQVLSATPSARMKRNPNAPDQPAQVLKDASFVLAKFPNAPIFMTSSTIDGYGRAALLDVNETVKEKDLLQQVLEQGPPEGERFDIDLMFWFNGWATLFNAVHMCLGDLYQDGAEIILARQRKDPLTHALHVFDRRLLSFYSEVRPDLEQQIENATGPHHLFHALTEDPAVRLHMTRRLIETG